jgi:hypothetical protein
VNPTAWYQWKKLLIDWVYRRTIFIDTPKTIPSPVASEADSCFQVPALTSSSSWILEGKAGTDATNGRLLLDSAKRSANSQLPHTTHRSGAAYKAASMAGHVSKQPSSPRDELAPKRNEVRIDE